MSSFKKVTIGWVTQWFDENGHCTGQDFDCNGCECDYEDEKTGELIEPPENEIYFPYNMEQPI